LELKGLAFALKHERIFTGRPDSIVKDFLAARCGRMNSVCRK
jgi:hypothetical protein